MNEIFFLSHFVIGDYWYLGKLFFLYINFVSSNLAEFLLILIVCRSSLIFYAEIHVTYKSG